MMVSRRFVIVFLLISQLLAAQENKLLLPRVNVRADCTIPRCTSSGAFRTSFLGLFDAGLSFNVRLFSNFNAGLGYNCTMFNSSTVFRNRGLNTRMQVHDAYLRIGYDHILAEKNRFLSIALKTGYSYNMYTSVVAIHDSLNGRHPTFFSGYFVRPEITINFMVEENFAFGATLAYNYCMYYYDPALNAFDTYTVYDRNNQVMRINGRDFKNRAPIGWLSFGFGFYYGFKRKGAAG